MSRGMQPGRIAIALAALWASGAACAFEPAFHQRYTKAAAVHLAKCPSNEVTLPTADEIRSFARGTQDEDDPSFGRIANWHYARNQQMDRFFIYPFQMNLDRRFDQRISQLFEHAASSSCARPEIFHLAGRVTHYIQDMRVPAHVIPINHGSIFGPEPFDKHEFKYAELGPPEYCQAWAAEAKAMSRSTLARMLAKARDDTRNRIHKKIVKEGKTFACTWSEVFWCDPAKEGCDADLRGFGTHRSDRFGASEVACGRNGARLTLDEADYNAFFREPYRMMLADTATALLLARELADRCTARAAAEGGKPRSHPP